MRAATLAAATLAAGTLAAGAPPACAQLSIQATTPLNTVEPHFASWNVDPSRDRLFFDVDWAEPQLLYLASAIGGARIRFGGTGADALYYELGGAPACGATVPGVYECLNATWWDGLQALSAAAAAPLVFGINIHPAGGPSPPKAAWNTTNAAALLRHAKAAGQGLYALEVRQRRRRSWGPARARRASRSRAPPSPPPPPCRPPRRSWATSRTRS